MLGCLDLIALHQDLGIAQDTIGDCTLLLLVPNKMV